MESVPGPDRPVPTSRPPHPAEPEAALAGWRVEAAAAARRRRTWLARAAEEEASLAAVVVDAAERGDALALELAGGDRVVGRAWSASPDVVALRRPGGDDVLVALGAVATLRVGGEALAGTPVGLPTGRTVAVPGDGSLAEALAGLVGERPVVAVRAADGRLLASGELLGVGRDVLTVGHGGGRVHVAVAAVATVAWRAG